jgi:hypothetical protein
LPTGAASQPPTNVCGIAEPGCTGEDAVVFARSLGVQRWAVLGGLAIMTSCHPAAPPVSASTSRDPDQERLQLRQRIVQSAADVAAHRALASLEDRSGRPAAALAALEDAARQQGGIGSDFDDQDRLRFGRLLWHRGLHRLRRGAASANLDLSRALALGWPVPVTDLRDGKVAQALTELRSSDLQRRRRGLATLATLAMQPDGQPQWRGAVSAASPAQQAALGQWLWQRGARRAGYHLLASWRARTPVAAGDLGPDPMHDLYLEALSWWSPSWRDDAPAPAAQYRFGPRRCSVTSPAQASAWRCDAASLVSDGWTSTIAELDVIRTVFSPTQQAEQAAAWTVIIVRAFLEGEVSDYGAELARRIDIAAVTSPGRLSDLPTYVRPTLLRLAGSDATAALTAALAAAPRSPAHRLLLGFEAALAGKDRDRILRQLAMTDDAGAIADDARSVRRVLAGADVIAPGLPSDVDADRAAAAAALTWFGADLAAELRLRDIAAGYRRDVAVARRKASDFIAVSPDAALAWAQLASLYLLIDDPGSSRLAWQQAIELSPEPMFQHGLALALAASGDGDAALLALVQAAANSGDPSAILLDGAQALLAAGSALHSLEIAKQAIELASPVTWRPALDVAYQAAVSLQRPELIAALRSMGGIGSDLPIHTEPAGMEMADRDPSNAALAIAAAALQSPAQASLRLEIAARWNPMSVAVRAALLRSIDEGDARRRRCLAELMQLARSADRVVAAAAVKTLRGLP